jgi:two-component system nitrate/nitrite response regulator NarL
VNRRQQLRQRLRQLSPRERQILHALYHGQRPATIAERCGIAIATVRSQIRSILIKLDVHSQLEAVALLHQHPLPDYVEAELTVATSLDTSSA